MYTHRVTPQTCTHTGSPLRHVHAQGHSSDMYTHSTDSPLTRAHRVTPQTCIQTGSPSGIQTGPFPDIHRHVHAQGHLSDMYIDRVTPRTCARARSPYRHVQAQGHTSDMCTQLHQPAPLTDTHPWNNKITSAVYSTHFAPSVCQLLPGELNRLAQL